MAELFQGEVQNRIDTKGRVSVPVAFRRVLEEGDPDFSAGQRARMSVLHWPKKNCLEVYSANGMSEMAAMIERHPPRSPMREALSRIVFGGSQPLQLDETGRVVIAEKLRLAAGLGEDVVFVGSMGKFEIWDQAAYEADTAAKLAQLEELVDLDAPFGVEPTYER